MKAIIPASGNGTRMVEVTSSNPKEMLIVNKVPLIYSAVMECIRADIKEIVIVIKKSKMAIKQYFDRLQEVENNSNSLLINKLQSGELQIEFVIQEQGNGSGGAILAAKKVIQNQDFIVIFPDVYIQENNSNLSKAVSLFNKHKCHLVLVDGIKKCEIDRYGIVTTNDVTHDYYPITQIIEKPNFFESDETFHGIIGRYVFKNNFINTLEKVNENEKNEIDLTEGLITEKRKFAMVIDGNHFECGSVSSYKKSLEILNSKESY